MTHITGNQMRSLSVRTRAFTHKNHECMARRRRFLKSSITGPRLRSRDLASAPTAQCSYSIECHASNLLTNSMYSNHLRLPNNPGVTSTQEVPFPQDVDSHSQSTRSSFSSLFCLSSSQSSCASFPSGVAASSTSSTDSENTNLGNKTVCMWENCDKCEVGDPSHLITHLQQVHVLPQVITGRRRCFTCWWRGCRVYGQPSVSVAWLEQHILLHTEARGKPFRCIFDACQLRFSTATLLERHIQISHLCRWETNNTAVVIASEEEETVSTALETNKVSNGADVESEFSSNTHDCQQNASSMANCAALSQFPLGGSNRRLVKRRQRPRCYRVRRIDFYDKRTCMVIENRLKLMHLFRHCGEQLSCLLRRREQQQKQNRQPSSCCSVFGPVVHCASPASVPTVDWPSRPTESTVRSPCQLASPRIGVTDRLRRGARHSSPSPSQCLTATADVPPLPPASFIELERFRRIALLLTVPHTFVGQRISENLRTELLVHWTGESRNDKLLPTWVFEDDLQAAVAMVAV